MSTTNRMTAQARRSEVLAAAAVAFAEGGYQGTTTEDIARRAGISQPYIFRLFGTKKDLFIGVVEGCFQRTVTTFEEAAKGLHGQEALQAMGTAYGELIRDPVVLLVEMHAFTAAAEDADVRRAAQNGMRTIWEMAAAVSGLDSDALRAWLATGMLCNVVAALGLGQLDEGWANQLWPAEKDCNVSGTEG